MTELTLEQIDLDGAIREALDNVSGDTRAAFLRKSVIAGGGLVGGGIALAAFPREARAATKGDVAILNFALTLEFLEASFYYYSVILGALSGPAKTMARVIYQHEQAHVNFLRKALGSAAVKKPKFNFQGTVEDQDLFLSTAQLLEDTGVGAYAGAAPSVKDDAILAAAVSVHSVEARHAAWVRHMLGNPPAPVAFDKPIKGADVLAAVRSTKFIVGF
jgi:hypothetical protein